MLLPILQIAIVGAIFYYLSKWRAQMRRRNVQSWDCLLVRLRTDWSAGRLSDQFLWKEGITATHADIWDRVDGAHGLWAMYQNAGVMLEMADYASKHGSSGAAEVDPLLLEALRSDAMQIRLCVLMALAQYGLSKATEGVCVNAYRAANHYSNMAARMMTLLQEHAAIVVPDYVAAM